MRRLPSSIAALVLSAVLAAGCTGQPPAGGDDATPDALPGATQPGTPGTATDRPTPAAPDVSPAPDSSGQAMPGSLPMGRLLFDSDRAGNIDIWYLEAGSDTPIQVTSDPGTDRIAAWGPDGTSVIFASDRLGGPSVPSRGALRAYGLFIAYLDGSPDRHLLGTRTLNHEPSYSPDGSRIVFYSDATGTNQVYLVDPDYLPNTGNEPVALTSDGHNDAPAWSPDGSRILFRSLRDGNAEIYVMDADGSNQLRLTDDQADDGSPAWSPDGSQIAFWSDRAGGRHIFVMNVDGSDVRQLTEGDVEDGFPSWSPDGEWIAFDREFSRDYIEILVIRVDGSELINLTNREGRDAFPAWGP